MYLRPLTTSANKQKILQRETLRANPHRVFRGRVSRYLSSRKTSGWFVEVSIPLSPRPYLRIIFGRSDNVKFNLA